MLKVNVSHSPLAVTLMSDEGIVGNYTGSIDHIVGQLVDAVYAVGTLDGYKAGQENCGEAQKPADELHRDITTYSNNDSGKGLFDNGSE